MKKAETYAVSSGKRHLYALAPSHYVDDTGKKNLIVVKAVWFHANKAGNIAVSEGLFYEREEDFTDLSWDSIMQGMVSPAYPIYTWDGTSMKTYMNTRLKTLAQERLTKILDNYPEIPQGYKGWYDMEIEEF